MENLTMWTSTTITMGTTATEAAYGNTKFFPPPAAPGYENRFFSAKGEKIFKNYLKISNLKKSLKIIIKLRIKLKIKITKIIKKNIKNHKKT
jgi:hypothetical protein